METRAKRKSGPVSYSHGSTRASSNGKVFRRTQGSQNAYMSNSYQVMPSNGSNESLQYQQVVSKELASQHALANRNAESLSNSNSNVLDAQAHFVQPMSAENFYNLQKGYYRSAANNIKVQRKK